jgi:hypothetical protein
LISSHSFDDKAWLGHRAFVIGGGPSIKGLDFSRLKGELAVGCNMAFLHNPTVNLIFDLRLMERLSTDPRWVAYGGVKCWLNSEIPQEHGRFPGVIELKERHDYEWKQRWSYSLMDGLWRGTNAGASALNLCEILGANPIYLLGFDFKGIAGRESNWHTEYPGEWHRDEKVYETFLKDFWDNRSQIKAEVVNLNLDSGLRCFHFADLDEVLSWPQRSL